MTLFYTALSFGRGIFGADFEWFRLFYLIAVAVGAILLIRAARRDGLPLSTTLVLFLWVLAFGIVGSRLAEWSLQDWAAFWETGRMADAGKTALGGILGAIIGLILGKWVMGLQAPVWGWFKAWPVVLILFRIGCVMGGCCAGVPTNLPWGVTYAAGTPAFGLQHAHGLLDGHAHASLPVHPVPIYEMIFAGLMLLMIARLGRRGWQPQPLFFLSLLAYAVFRFAEEFIRPENATDAFLNPVQWALLAAIPVLVLQLVMPTRAKRRGADTPSMTTYPAHAERRPQTLLGIILPLAFIFLLRNFWTTGEYLALGMLVFAYGIIQFTALLQHRHRGIQRWMVAGSLAIGLLLMGQAAIDQEPMEESWVEAGMGVAAGSYPETCGSTHTFGALGLGGQYTRNWDGRHQIEAGARGYFGSDKTDSLQRDFIGAQPYFGYQNRWVGVEVNGNVGQLVVNAQERTFIPGAALRLGPSDLAFLEGRIFTSGYTPLPSSFWRIGVGSGLGLLNGTVIRAGLSSNGVYVNPTLVFSQKFMVEPLAAYADRNNYQFGLGLRMKIGL
jgi:prolipoprotein diacylglyceryltransferase